MPTDRFVGSQLAVPLPVLRREIGRLQTEVHSARESATTSWPNLLRAHNYFTAYTTLLLIHGTGHRPTRDPFCYGWRIGQGFVLIEDKVSSPNHRLRLSVFPSLARQQLARYQHYLGHLAADLASHWEMPALGQAIATALHWPGAVPNLPQLFFLEGRGSYSVAPKTLGPWLEPWPWPLNLGRKLVWQGLRDRGVPPEWVRAQVGHMEWGESPWGPAAANSPSQFGQMAPHLDALLADQGWEAMEGPVPTSQAPMWTLEPSSASQSVPHRPALLGPEARARERDQRARNYRREIWRVIRGVTETPPQTPISSLTPDQARTIYRSVMTAFSGNPALKDRAASLVRRWLRRRTSPALTLPRRRSITPPPFPFSSDWLDDLGKAQVLKEAFLAYLAEQEGPSNAQARSTSPLARRVAEVVMSAALIGGMGSRERLAALPKALNTTTWRMQQTLLVDAPETTSHRDQPGWRWIPDSVSAGLIAGGVTNWSGEEVPTITIKAQLRKLLIRLGGNVTGRDDPFAVLARWVRPLAEFQVPGLWREYWVGDASGSPLPRTVCHRLVAEKRLPDWASTRAASNSERTKGPGRAALPPGRGSAERSGRRSFLAAFRGVIQQARQTRAKGGRNIDSQQKRALIDGFTELFPEGHGYPSVAVVLGEWGRHLAHSGTRSKRVLKFSTIETYLTRVATPLVELGWEVAFQTTEPEDREALFEEALDYAPTQQEQAFLGSRFREFHHYLEDQHGLEPLDWGFLPQGVGEQAPEAQLLTPTEYRRALALLRDASDRSPGDGLGDSAHPTAGLLAATALLLGYRFGLRGGEAFRVRPRDLDIDRKTGLVVVHVVPNPFGTPKSRAGRRSVPNVEGLDNEEIDLLEMAREAAVNQAPSSGFEPSLFADPNVAGRLENRGPIINQIQTAMRMASGEPALRFHHLRHGYANRLFWGLVIDQWPEADQVPWVKKLLADLDPGPALRTFLTEREAFTDTTLDALAQAMGHTSAEVTRRHYLHTLEPLIQAATDAHIGKRLAISTWSYIQWKPEGVLKKRQRSQGAPGLPFARNWLDGIKAIQIPGPKGAIGNLPPLPTKPPTVSLPQIDKLFVTALTFRGDAERAAKVVGIPGQAANRLLRLGQEVAEEAWFAELVESSGDPRRGPANKISSQERASAKVREGLGEWEARLAHSPPEVIENGLTLWKKRHDHRSGTIWLTRQEEFDTFLAFAVHLGFAHELECRPGAGFAREVPSAIREELDQAGVTCGQPMRQNPPAQGLVKPDWVGGIRIQPGGQWARQGRLNRALFGLAVFWRFSQ